MTPPEKYLSVSFSIIQQIRDMSMGYPEFYKGLEDVVDIKQLSFESPRLNEGNRDFIPDK